MTKQPGKAYMSKELSNALKGIALIMMFIHHFFTFPSWYIEGIEYPSIAPFVPYLNEPFKMCVPVFAFLTGYLYAFNKQPTFRYSIRKITDIYISYWIIFIPFLCITIYLDCYTYTLRDIVLEGLALKRNTMVFCWYVSFYGIFMMLLPILNRMLSYSIGRDIVIIVLLPSILFHVVQNFVSDNAILKSIAIYFVQYFPTIAMGLIFGKYSLFENVFDKLLLNWQSNIFRFIIVTMAAALAFFGRFACHNIWLGNLAIGTEKIGWYINMDLIYTPIFIYAATWLLKKLNRYVVIFLRYIGKYSLLMWFIHCIFFNVCKQYTQKILYWPGNAVLVLLNGLVLCGLLASIIYPILNKILNIKNCVFDKMGCRQTSQTIL